MGLNSDSFEQFGTTKVQEIPRTADHNLEITDISVTLAAKCKCGETFSSTFKGSDVRPARDSVTRMYKNHLKKCDA